MKQISWCALAVALALAPSGCKQKKSETGAGTAPAPMASIVRMNDSRVAGQLLSGFYGIENGAWRWTAKQFTLALATPAGAAQRGAVLELKLTVPPVTIQRLQKVELSANVNGSALPAETYTEPGQFSYRREISGAVLAGNSARIAFQLDKAMAPSGADLRELGVIVSSASLQAK
jgi:hypothetical protein